MNTDELIAHGRARFEHAAARRTLREKYQARLLFAHNGGMFRATPELLAFVNCWPTDIMYLEDAYQNPIEVDRQVFLVQIQQHYQEQMNAWHKEYSELNQNR
jgi:hypothetical protein